MAQKTEEALQSKEREKLNECYRAISHAYLNKVITFNRHYVGYGLPVTELIKDPKRMDQLFRDTAKEYLTLRKTKPNLSKEDALVQAFKNVIGQDELFTASFSAEPVNITKGSFFASSKREAYNRLMNSLA